MGISDLTDRQKAYIAGLLDGDGHLGLHRSKPTGRRVTPCFRWRVTINMVTPEPIHTLAEWFDMGYTTRKPPSSNRSKQYRLRLNKKKALQLLRACLPYLILKRRQAEIMLEAEEIREQYSPGRHHFGKDHIQRFPQEGVDKLNKLYRESKSLKLNKRPSPKGRK